MSANIFKFSILEVPYIIKACGTFFSGASFDKVALVVEVVLVPYKRQSMTDLMLRVSVHDLEAVLKLCPSTILHH